MNTATILLNYNNHWDTELCINSLKKHAPTQKIVVVDNNSIGNEIDFICKKFTGVKLLKNSENIGFGRGNNTGIKWALKNTNKKYILILNNDTYIKDDAIDILENFMENNPKISGCSARIVYADRPNILWYGGGELNWKRGGAISKSMNKPFDGNLSNKEVDFITGCCMMIRRELFEKIGGFDPRYFMYYEDVEFCARIKKNSGKLFYIPQSIIYHRVHGSIRKSNENLEHNIKPQYEFYIEHSFCNTLLTFTNYANYSEKFWGSMYLSLRWLRTIFVYVKNKRFHIFIALYKAIRRFFRMKKIQFYNELL